MERLRVTILILLFLSWTGCTGVGEPTGEEVRIENHKKQLVPLAKPLEEPKPGDWLAEHSEPGQTFRQYVASNPVTPRGKRRKIYIQPIGEFTKEEERIVRLTADFMGHYFMRKVTVKKTLSDDVVPEKARRTHPEWGVKQFRSTWILHELLEPALPEDAACLIAFTATDLWPGPGWNFVFGQASLRKRGRCLVDCAKRRPTGGGATFRLCLLRTLKTATHETGHMFSMKHCIAYSCNMCGSNHREESDRRPLHLCPECVAKVWWATGADPIERYRRLLEFCKAQNLSDQTSFYASANRALDDD